MMAEVDTSGGYGPKVLVVDDDPSIGRLVRIGLETEGYHVVLAASVSAARRSLDESFVAVVLDRQLPDGDGLGLVSDIRDRAPGAAIVVHSTLEADGREPLGAPVVAKGDVGAIIDALGGGGRKESDRPLAIVELIDQERAGLVDDWQELCHWDPMLPPDSIPAMADEVLSAIARALEQPQPLGWGPDPRVEAAASAFAHESGSIEIAIEQLVCLREALVRRLAGRIPPEELAESSARLHMVVDRAIGVAAQRATSRLQSEALTDELTGLLNRRALERNLRRELSRASRYGRIFTVGVIDIDGLKAINDTYGHPAGDRLLGDFAASLVDSLRAGDSAYRTGGDEFALLLPETDGEAAQTSIQRLQRSVEVRFTWGVATYPVDGDNGARLVELADRRMYERRSAQRRQAG
jgi:diguanylate cyclase (GGDEF)-like protein